jgi:hypothetical protein
VPHLQNLFIITYDFGDVYSLFMRVVQERHALRRVRLRLVLNKHPERRLDSSPLPNDEVLARLRKLTAESMLLTLETPTYRWPEESSDDIDAGGFNLLFSVALMSQLHRL